MGMSFSMIEKSATRKCAFKDLKLAERKWTASSRIRAVLVIKVHYCSGVSCPHIESLPTLSAAEVIRRPIYRVGSRPVSGPFFFSPLGHFRRGEESTRNDIRSIPWKVYHRFVALPTAFGDLIDLVVP